MSEFVVNLIFLAIGAGISLGTAFFLNERSHKLEREDRKLDRSIAAREIRLKEGEERIKILTSEFYYVMKLNTTVINAQSEEEIINAQEEITIEHKKINEEIDKGNYFNEVSVSSLLDKELIRAWGDVRDSSTNYQKFYFTLLEKLTVKGFTTFQNESKIYNEMNLKLAAKYLSSVREFLSRINELRSQ